MFYVLQNMLIPEIAFILIMAPFATSYSLATKAAVSVSANVAYTQRLI